MPDNMLWHRTLHRPPNRLAVPAGFRTKLSRRQKIMMMSPISCFWRFGSTWGLRYPFSM